MPDEQRVLTFDPAVLLDAEAVVIARVARGEVATFAGTPPPVLRAAFLRYLLLGLPVGPPGAVAAEPWAVRLPGIRIRGARIEDALDLADCAGPAGAGLPGLALEACGVGTLLTRVVLLVRLIVSVSCIDQ